MAAIAGVETRPESRRLEYRPIAVDDLIEIVALHADPAVRALLVDGIPDTLPKAFAFLDWNAPLAARGYGTFAVRRRGEPALIGLFSLTPFEGDDSLLELGGKLAPAAWRGNLSVEAGAAMIAYAFGPLGRERLVSAFDPAQRSAAAALGRLGFVDDGAASLFGRPVTRFLLTRDRWRAQGEAPCRPERGGRPG